MGGPFLPDSPLLRAMAGMRARTCAPISNTRVVPESGPAGHRLVAGGGSPEVAEHRHAKIGNGNTSYTPGRWKGEGKTGTRAKFLGHGSSGGVCGRDQSQPTPNPPCTAHTHTLTQSCPSASGSCRAWAVTIENVPSEGSPRGLSH